MLEPAMLIGLGAVAVWTYVNYPRLRPGSLVRAIVHVAVSFAALATLPCLRAGLLSVIPHPQMPYILLAALILAMTYMLLSWVWLIARILHDLLGGSPRGGHPVSAKS